MLFRLNPFAKNGIEIVQKPQVVIQGTSSSSSSSFPAISYGTATPVNGVDTPSHFYYDTDDAITYIYVNGVWYALGGTTPPVTTGADIFGLLLTRNLA